MSKDFYFLDINIKTDDKGSLTAFEKGCNCPFEIKRLFYITNVPNKDIVRANHINKNTSMVVIPVKGSCEINLNKQHPEKFVLNSPEKGLYIKKGVYRELYNFTKDALILCLCDNYYDINEYECD